MLKNAYFLAKIGADTAENEQHFAEILPKIGNYPGQRPPPRGAGTSKAGCLPLLAAKRTVRVDDSDVLPA